MPPLAPRRTLKIATLLLLCAAAGLLAWMGRHSAFQDQEVLWRSQRLRSRDPSERAVAIDELESIVTSPNQAETLRPILLKLAMDSEPAIRARGIGLLASLQRASLFQAEALAQTRAVLSKALRDPDPVVRRAAVLCYGNSYPLPESSIAPLQTLLSDDDAAVRAAAYTGIIGSKARWADRCALVRQGMEDPAPEVRVAVLSMIGTKYVHINSILSIDDATAAAIASALDDPWSRVAEEAARALARLPAIPSASETALLGALASENTAIARYGAEALCRVRQRSPRVERSLVDALDASDYHLSAAAATALAEIAANPAPVPALWRTHLRWAVPERDTQTSAPPSLRWSSPWAEALIRLAPQSTEARKAMAGLIANLNDNEPNHRLFAAQSLERLGVHAASALAVLRECAADPTEPNAALIRRALATVEAAIESSSPAPR